MYLGGTKKGGTKRRWYEKPSIPRNKCNVVELKKKEPQGNCLETMMLTSINSSRG